MIETFILLQSQDVSLQRLLQSPPRKSANSLEEVVRHFLKTAPLGRGLAVRIEGELAKQIVEVVEVSSGEESSEEEVEIVLEKSTAGPVEGRSSDSSGRIILARAWIIFSLY